MIQRKIYQDLKKHLSQKEISLIIGPRQAGKTTLMLLLKEELDKKGEKTLFLNLDIEADKQFFTSQKTLVSKIELEIGKSPGFVFIDEIQRKEDAGVFLKGIYDMNLPYKFVVSGSGSVELKEKIHESLAGRKRLFELNTVSFSEFVSFKTEYRYEDKLEQFLELEKDRIMELFQEYLNFGGYPRVILAQTIEEKKKIIEEIYASFVEKDLVYLLGLQKIDDLNRLLRIIASQIGNLVNYSELSSTLGLSQITISKYLWYLEKTFILDKITPFYRNLRSEITKSPTYYYSDVGLRNFILGIFGNFSQTSEDGFLYQNFIYRLIKDQSDLDDYQIHFWRTKDGAETDFILEKGQEVIPIEVKFAQLKKEEISRSFRSFINKYEPSKAYLVNLSFNSQMMLDKTQIQFIPFSYLLVQ